MDRIRETLFNWLDPHINAAICLDLFAGSGVLGLEALSRGAKRAVMVDSQSLVIDKIRDNAMLLKASDDVEAFQAKLPDKFSFLETSLKLRKYSFDIVFLDPPYHKNLIKPCCDWLLQSNLLAPKALIYIEVEKDLDIAAVIPEAWKIIKHSKTGNISYALIATHPDSE
jgi:16S rRNA (guanine966-N2)-methyltransferase